MSRGEDTVVVVGGGVIGLAVAWEIIRRGARVRVLDRGEPSGVATRAAAGMLAPVSEAEVEDPEVLDLARDSLERYPRFVADLEACTGSACGFRTDGTLWVAVNRDDLAELDHLEGTLRDKLGGRGFRRLGAAEILEREPHLTGRTLGGLLVEGDLQVDPRALAAALERAVITGGGAIDREMRVEEIATAGGRVQAVRWSEPDGGAREMPCRRVVLAAGAWSTEQIRSPLEAAAIRPVKGQIVRLRGAPLLHRVVRHPEVYLVPRESGELLVGSTMEELGFDTTATAGVVHDLLRRARQVLPGIYDLELVEVSVGLRPVSRDNRPVLGPTATEGLFAALGHGRQGILLAPVTAHHVAEAVISTGADAPELAAFRAGRFESSPEAGSPVGRAGG